MTCLTTIKQNMLKDTNDLNVSIKAASNSLSQSEKLLNNMELNVITEIEERWDSFINLANKRKRKMREEAEHIFETKSNVQNFC